MKTKIIIFSANPLDTENLGLGREFSEIEEAREKSNNENKFTVLREVATTVDKIQRKILEEKPRIVHFCGHGLGENGLVLETKLGKQQPIRNETLAKLFKLLANRVECVILNACYSQEQAAVIQQHINYVIGTRNAIRDDAAIAFSKGFYTALFSGESIEHAYELGKNRIQPEVYNSNNQGRKLVPVDSEEGGLPEEDVFTFHIKEPLNEIESEPEKPGFQAIIEGGRIGIIDSRGNALGQFLIPQHWKRPQVYDPQRRGEQIVGREQQLEEIRERFTKTENRGGTYLAIYGLPGIGKSTLAAAYASIEGTEANYPGGVLWTNAAVEDAQQILTQWAREAYREEQWRIIQTNSQSNIFEPESIRKMMTGHGSMLVILDDVRSFDVIQYLRRALPVEANVMLTTRDGTLASQFMENTGQSPIELDRLNEDDAVRLLQVGETSLQAEELFPLVAAVGAHPQTLRIIAAQIRQLSTTERRREYLQSLLDDINSGEETNVSQNFETAFSYLYNLISDKAPEERTQHQKWLRYLGVLVPTEAGFSTEMASMLWDTDVSTAATFLERMSEYSIVQPTLEGRWSQNRMVHSALLRKLQEQRDELELAIHAYIRCALQLVFQIQNLLQDSQWIIYDLPHMFRIGEVFLHELEEKLDIDLSTMELTHILEYQSDPTVVTENFKRNEREGLEILETFLQRIVPYLIHNSLESSLIQHWLATGYITSILLDNIDERIVILVYWSKWLSSQERVEEARQVLAQISAIANRSSQEIDVQMWARSEQADLFRISGDIQGAISALQECDDLFKRHEGIDPYVYSNLYENFGLVYFYNSEWQKALDYFNLAYDRLDSDEESLQRLEIIQFIALCHGKLGYYEEALQFFAKIEKYFDSQAIVSIKSTLLRIKGGIHTRTGALADAEEDLLQAMKSADDMGQIPIFIAAQNQLAEIKMSQGTFDEALSELENARQLLQYAPDRNLETMILGNLGLVYYSLGDLKKALDYLKKSLGMLSELQDPPTLTEEFVVVGQIFQTNRQIREGLNFFKEALTVASEQKLYSSEIAVIQGMALLYFEDGNPQEALQLFKKVELEADSITNREERGFVLMKMADLYFSIGNMRESLKLLNDALIIWQDLGNIHFEAETLIELANIYYLRRDLKQFHDVFERSEKLLPTQSKRNRLQFHRLQGIMQLEKQEYEEALKNFQLSAEFSSQIDALEEYIINLLMCANSYFFMGDLKSARWELEKALERLENTNQSQLQSVVQMSLGMMHISAGNLERGRELIRSGISLLDQNNLRMDTGGPIFELLYYYQDLLPYLDMHFQKLDRSPADALRILIRASNWFVIEQLLPSLITALPDVVSLINQQIQNIQDKTLKEVFRLYRQLFEKAKQESISAAIDWARNNFRSPEMYHWRGLVMLERRAYFAALAHFNQAIEKNRTRASFYASKGWALRGMGSYTAAIENFTRAIELAPDMDEGYLGRGVVYFEHDYGLQGQALSDLGQAIELNKKRAISYQWRGSLSLLMGDIPSAQKDLDMAVKLETKNSDHLYWRGLVKLRSKDYPGAIDDLKKVCDQDSPDSMEQAYAMLWCGLAHRQRGEAAYAESYWKQGQNIADKLANPFQRNLVKGLCCVMSNQYDFAYNAYDAVTKLHFVPHVIIGQVRHLYLLVDVLDKERNDLKEMISRLEEQWRIADIRAQ